MVYKKAINPSFESILITFFRERLIIVIATTKFTNVSSFFRLGSKSGLNTVIKL